jgi:TPR repeat protein
LEKLEINMNGKTSEGDTILHLLIKQSKDLPQGLLKRRDIDLEAVNKNGATPLDIAMEKQLPQTVVALINAGVGSTVNPTEGWKFYNEVVLKSNDPTLTVAFQLLIERNMNLTWKMTRESIFPAKGNYPIVSATFGPRSLHPDAVKQLFNEKGVLIRFNETGKRDVGKATVNGFTIYLKQAPELPGVEQAVGALMREMVGFGAPNTDLVIINGIPYLASQGVPGLTLQKVLKEHPEQLAKLDPEHLSQVLLMTMHINPEDGKPDNYIINGYQIVMIDNDHAFVPSVAKETFLQSKKNRVQVKSILFCLDQMRLPIYPSVKRQFLMHNPSKILKKWLKHLSFVHNTYTRVLKDEEREYLYEKYGVFVGIPFRQEVISNLYRKIVKMQSILDEHKDNPNFTHLDLLLKLDKPLGDRYRAGFTQQYKTPWDRFVAIDGEDYEMKNNSFVSTRRTKELLPSYDITTKADMKALIKGGKTLDPDKALQHLKEVIESEQKALVQLIVDGEKVDLSSLSDEKTSDVLQKSNFSTISVPVEQSILKQIKNRPLKNLSMPHAEMVTDVYLTKQNVTNLTHVNLSNCQNISQNAVAILAQAPQLTILNLSGIRSFNNIHALYGITKNLMALYSFGQKQIPMSPIPLSEDALNNLAELNLNKITHLYLRDCQNLQTLKVKGDNLVLVDCANDGLRHLRITSPTLSNLDITNNKKLSDESLDATITKCKNIRRLTLEGCDNIKNQDIRTKFPSYPMSLLANISQETAKIVMDLLTNKIEGLEGSEEGLHRWDKAGIKAVCFALKFNTSLQYLFLDKMEIESEEAEYIAEGLKLHPLLEHISLNDNKIGFRGAAAFFTALESNKSLKSLNLSGNLIGLVEAKSVAVALQFNSTLISLDLSNNNLGNSVEAFSDALKSNNSLEKLNLSENSLDPQAINSIFAALKNNTSLKELYLEGRGNGGGFCSIYDHKLLKESGFRAMDENAWERANFVRDTKNTEDDSVPPAPSEEPPLLQFEDSTPPTLKSTQESMALRDIGTRELTPDALYHLGRTVEASDHQEAIDYYFEAATKKNKEALTRLEELAANSLQARYALGCYFESDGKPSEAAVYYAMAAAGTHLKAKQALYRLARENNNPVAQSQLAVLLERGIGVNEDLQQALVLHKKAADQGVALSQLRLGLLYYSGTYLEKNEQLGLALIQQAEMQGLKEAVVVLAQIQKEEKEKRRILDRASDCDKALYTIAHTKTEAAKLFDTLPLFDKQKVSQTQAKVQEAQVKAKEEEAHLLAEKANLQLQANQAGDTIQGSFLKKQIEAIDQKLNSNRAAQAVYADPLEGARQYYLNEKRQLFYSGLKEKIIHRLEAVDAILSGNAERAISFAEQQAVTMIIKASSKLFAIAMKLTPIPVVGFVGDLIDKGVDYGVKKAADEIAKKQFGRIQGYYPEKGLKGIDQMASILAGGFVYKFQDHVPHLDPASLNQLINHFDASIAEYLYLKAPADASLYEILMGATYHSPFILKELILRKPLKTNYNLSWPIDDLLGSTGIRTIYGGRYLPIDPKRQAFLNELDKEGKAHEKQYPNYRLGTKEEVEMLENRGIVMKCVEEERAGALASTIDYSKAAMQFMQEVQSFASMLEDLKK